MAAKKKTTTKASKKAAAKKPAAKKAPVSSKTSGKKKTAKKAAGKKAAGKKTAAKKAPAKKAAAKKAQSVKSADSPKSSDGPKKSDSSKAAAAAAPAVEKKAGGDFTASQVNLGHIFALRPRVPTSFRPEDLRSAKHALADESFESVLAAARAVAEKALELIHDGPSHTKKGRNTSRRW